MQPHTCWLQGEGTSALSNAGGTTNLLATHTVAADLLPAQDASLPLALGQEQMANGLDDDTLGDLQAPPALPAAWQGALTHVF